MPINQLDTNLLQAADLIRKSRNIILACHLNPDGDAIGSMLGLGLALRKIRKSVVMLCADKIPERYIMLPGAKSVKRAHQGAGDVAISVDCGGMNQLAKIEEVFNKSKRIIEIDHHAYRTRFGDVQLIDDKACSVGEIVYLFLEKLKIPCDHKICECLLTSLLVETLSFSRQDVKTVTFDIMSKLMKSGVDFRKISDRYYWRKKLSVMHLSGLCLTRVKLVSHNKLAWSIVSKADYEKYRGRQEDVDAVPDDMMLIEDVKVAILFREIDDGLLRVSLRSRDNVDIGYLASIYGGGGHHDVAGCRIHNNEKNIQKFILQACRLLNDEKTAHRKE